MKKRFFPILMVLVLVISLIPATVVHANDIRVTIDGQSVIFPDQHPVIVDSRTLVPVRGVFEALGFDVDWDDSTRTAILVRHDYQLRIPIGSYTFTTNGASHTLDVPAQIIGGRTMVPLRFPLESVGYILDWDAGTQTVVISSPVPDVLIEIGGEHFSVSLTSLDLSDRGLTNEEIMTLRYMTNLSILNLSGNQISDLSPLADLTSLTNLSLDGNHITDLSPLSRLTNLTRLSLSNNLIRDWSPVAHIGNVIRGREAPFNYTRSAIVLPNRKLTDTERQEWIAEYLAMGGPSEFELEVLRLVNVERHNYGLNPLAIDMVFMYAARFYAQTLANHDLPLGHREGPYGGSANTVLAFGGSRQGHRNGMGGGWTPEAVVQGWMNSPGHRSNILVTGHTRFGFGSQLGGQWGVFHYMVLSSGAVQESFNFGRW